MTHVKQKIVRSLLVLALLLPLPVAAEDSQNPEGLELEEQIGEKIPLDLMFRDENGAEVVLEDFFASQRNPVLIIPSYYNCPRLCPFIFQGVQKAAAETMEKGVEPGRDYTILSVSFDPREGPELARENGQKYREMFGADAEIPDSAWRFLTGDETNIRALMDAIGFNYRPDGETDFSHGAFLALIDPAGTVNRYLYGIRYEERNYRMSLVEASNGRIGGIGEQIFLYCFRYDPQEGRYTPFAWAFMRIGAALILITLVALIFFLRREEKHT